MHLMMTYAAHIWAYTPPDIESPRLPSLKRFGLFGWVAAEWYVRRPA